MLIIYGSSLHSPRTVASPIKVTRSGVMGKLAQLYPQVQLHRLLAAALQNDMQITAGQRNNFINLWTHIGVEFTQNVRCTHSTPGEGTLAILVSIFPLVFFLLDFSL